MAPSAYFSFCAEHRAAAQKELSDAAGGAKVSAAEVGKTLGQKWRQLSDDEKAKYKSIALAEASGKENRDTDGGAVAKAQPASKVQRPGGKRAPTPYFIFMDEQRAAVQKELAAASEGGAKIPLGTVAKAIGERWRNLTDEEKDKYKAKAQAKAAELSEAAAAVVGEDEAGGTEAPAAAEPAKPSFPLGTVKRIMSADDEFTRITGDGLKHLVTAAELFLSILAKKAGSQAGISKRRTIKFSDVLGAARADKRMRPVSDLLGKDEAFAAARGERQPTEGEAADDQEPAEGQAKSKKAKKAQDDPKTKRITEFFRV